MLDGKTTPAPGGDVARLLLPPAATLRSPGARLTEGFHALEAEIAKLDRAAGAGRTSWKLVVECAETYLVEVLKDLRVAAYLALAWAERGDGRELARGFALLAGLLDGHWEQAFPPPDKLSARAGALSWLTERLQGKLGPWLEVMPPEDAAALATSYEGYRAAVQRRFEGQGPTLGGIDEALALARRTGRIPPRPETAGAATSVDAPASGLAGPIGGGEPAGSDPKLSDEFDRLYTELQRLESMSGHPVRWSLVRDTAAEILVNQGKDLRCLVYWAHARAQLEALAGLREGLGVVAQCVERFGDELHPRRPKARAAALRWLGARFEQDLPTLIRSVPKADREAMLADVDRIEAGLKQHCASMEGLQRGRSALLAIRVEAPKPRPKPTTVAKPAAAAAEASAASAAPPPAASTGDPGLREVVARMLEQAQALRAAEGESAVSLRLRRQALWMIDPPLIKGKSYECSSVPVKVRSEVERLHTAKRWPELLERSEELFLAHPFCLDLTRFTAAAAAEVLGEAARDAVIGETRALATRGPKLARGFDRDGATIASKETRAWLAELLGSAPADKTPAASPAASASTAAAATEAADALPAGVEALLKGNKLAEAMTLGSATAAGLTGRAAFRRNLLLAERLSQRDAKRLAYPLFRALMAQLRSSSLVGWEPRAGARCIRGYLQCARANKDAVQDERALQEQLMLLDPGAAVGLL